MEDNALALELLQPGKNVHLEFFDENGKKIIYRSSIWSFEEEQLTLLMPKNDYILNNTKSGTKIMVVCRNDRDNHDYVFATQFIKTDVEQPLLTISKPANLDFSLGRHFFRCEVNLPFHIFNKKEKCKGEVTNLSANGLHAIINPSLHLDPGVHLTCQIILPDVKEPLIFVAKVIRIVKKENFQGIGLSFQHMPKNIQDRITKYLFQRQRALINLGQIRIVKSEG